MRAIELHNKSRYSLILTPQELLLKEKEKILLVEPDNILQGRVFSRLGYNVQIHQGVPPVKPKYKIGDVLLEGKFTVTQLLTYNHLINYVGSYTYYKDDGKKETLNSFIVKEDNI